MGISAYNGLSYLNYYNRNLFTSPNPNASKITNNLYTITSQANYYKTVANYVINNKYNNDSANSSTPNTSSSISNATDFLKNFDKSYNQLKSTSNTLKNKLNSSTTDIENIIAATQEFVTAYNNTSKFLNEHSDSSTHYTNMLKTSLSNAVNSTSSSYLDIGITTKTDGSLTLDENKLLESLNNNTRSTTNVLSQLTNRIESSTSMATHISKAGLIREQNTLSTNSISDDATYQEFLNMSKNAFQLRNYYFGLSSLGIFMDISI